MYFTRKSMSEASKTIFKEQRELTKERILGNPEHPEEHIYLEQMNLGEIFLFV